MIVKPFLKQSSAFIMPKSTTFVNKNDYLVKVLGEIDIKEINHQERCVNTIKILQNKSPRS
jgi:hypothetical protein